MQMISALDKTIYPWLLEYGSFQTYDYLDGEKNYREDQKQKFVSDEIINPVLDYPNIDLERIQDIEENLIAFRDLLKGDSVVYPDGIPQDWIEKISRYDYASRTAYISKLNEKIAELRLLKATSLLSPISQSDSVEFQAIIVNRFKRYTEFIYGKPNKDIFSLTLQEVNITLQKARERGDSEQISIAEELENLINMNQPDDKIDQPDIDTFQTAKTQTQEELGSLVNFEYLSDNGKLNAEEIKVLFEEALRQIEAEGWIVRIDSSTSRTGIHVSHENKEIVIPETRSANIDKVKALILHELGTHVARRINGERSKLQLLGLGLDRYKDDEGIATMREQIQKEEFQEYSGFEAHLAIGLCYGLDGKGPRDFRQTFEILKRFFKLEKLIEGKESEEAESSANNKAWNRCIRTFRGTNCSIPGICFTKDIFYRESNIEIWRIWKENPSAALTFNLGKFDPANSRHLMLLSELDILESDLEMLDK